MDKTHCNKKVYLTITRVILYICIELWIKRIVTRKCFIICFEQASLQEEEITNLDKRSVILPSVSTMKDSVPLPLNTNFTIESSEIEEELNESLTGPITIHRVANIPLSKARAARPKPGGGSRGQDDTSVWTITDQEYLEYLDLQWWSPGLLATALFACSTVITFLRLFPYVVLSDITGPLQISVGSMVKQTLHFFWVVGVVTLSFAVGITYIYAFYDDDEVRNEICLEINNLSGGCRKGTLAK